MFRFLADEDDDVSGGVATFAQDYISLLKTFGQLSKKQRENMEVNYAAFVSIFRLCILITHFLLE